jgi:predicted transcriptional regulator
MMPYQQFKNYTMAIARGQYKPKKIEPKIWFESIKSLAQVLSNENQLLLQLIIDRESNSSKANSKTGGIDYGFYGRIWFEQHGSTFFIR